MVAWALPELEVQNIAVGIYAHEGLRPPSWITIIGVEEIAALGGLEVLQAALPVIEGFILTPYEGGLSIQAGPEPLTRAKLLGSWEEFIENAPSQTSSFSIDPKKMVGYAQEQGFPDKYENALKLLLNGEFLPIPKAPREDFSLLYKLAKVLKPLRAKLPRQLHDGYYGAPYFDQARTLEYYARFDDESEF
ncbi:hypothetical protein D9M71_432920 [compost metagenome]